MSLPYLQSAGGPKHQRTVGQWKGLDERLIIDDESFSAMQNLSSRFFPAVATRLPRGAAQSNIVNPHGLYHKNGLFWISDNRCYYNGNEIPGLTVTDGDKQIVGMGAYICIFPDKKIYNTATGEVTAVDATYTQSGTITFAELSADSVFCKITANGINNVLRSYDGVTFNGVNDSVFMVDGKPATKVITEAGTDYIVVSAAIQKGISGAVEMLASDNGTRINLENINTHFSSGDVLKVIGCDDNALNGSGRTVTSAGSGYVVVGTAFPAKSYTQSGTMTLEPFSASQIRLVHTGLGTTFSKGDVVTIAGCSTAGVNGSKTIRAAGSGYIVIDGVLSGETTQASGITINRTKHTSSNVTIKRTSFTRSSGITITRNSQDFDYVCEHDNRLWACSSANHEIYASKLGDPSNWNCFEGISTDSYVVTVGSDGNFTGCCSHMGQVLFFKEQSIHMMYGSRPSNYQLNEKQMPGVRAGCSRSLCVVDETLYYVGRSGVYVFDGAMPKKISENITSDLSDAVACQQDSRYYLSCLKDGKRAMLVYDPRLQVWDQEDDTRFKFAAYGDGTCYYIDSANALRTITGNDSSIIWWSMESGDLRESSLDQKYISKAQFNLWLDAGAEADIYFRFDEDPIWHRAGTIHSVVSKTYTIPIVPQRCSRFRWKMEGKGQMKLLAMGISVEGGSEINGSIQSWFRH